MKKLPCPQVLTSYGPEAKVVTLEWDWIALQMHEDQALLLARSIYDVLQEPPETDGGPLSPWGET